MYERERQFAYQPGLHVPWYSQRRAETLSPQPIHTYCAYCTGCVQPYKALVSSDVGYACTDHLTGATNACMSQYCPYTKQSQSHFGTVSQPQRCSSDADCGSYASCKSGSCIARQPATQYGVHGQRMRHNSATWDAKTVYGNNPGAGYH
jgi:hypothetical protein